MSIFCRLSFFYKQQNQERLGFYMKANNGWMDGKQDYTINMKHESHNRNILLFEGRTGGESSQVGLSWESPSRGTLLDSAWLN